MRRRASGCTEASDGERDELGRSTHLEKKIKNLGLLSSNKRVFLLCLGFRVINSLLVQTYFNPDEHWQALEVAHQVTFGYGHLTWEWRKGLRSYLHPLVFALLYKFLHLCNLDTPWFMARAPRLLQSLFCAVGDLYLYRFSNVLFGLEVSRWTLFSQLTNWFMFFCFTRTLSNSLETVLTLVSLFYWPCLRASSGEQRSASRKCALVLAALACAVRPTSAVIWLYVGILELLLTHDKLRFMFLETIPIGALVLTLASILDRLFYGSWVLVPLNFLKFNFLSSGVAGIFQSKLWKLSGLVLWVLGLYSVQGHKEFRFVLPVLPVALLFSGYSLAALDVNSSQKDKKVFSKTRTGSSWKLKLSVFFLLVTNVPMAMYMTLVHQRGAEDVMNYLSREAIEGKVQSVLFLMPCHATPYYSTLHLNLPMQFLDCTPSDEKGILDESDRFLADPVGFTSEYFKNISLPSHIILFESEVIHLIEFLKSHSYSETRRFFHAHFKVDRDLQASVVVYTSTNS